MTKIFRFYALYGMLFTILKFLLDFFVVVVIRFFLSFSFLPLEMLIFVEEKKSIKMNERERERERKSLRENY